MKLILVLFSLEENNSYNTTTAVNWKSITINLKEQGRVIFRFLWEVSFLIMSNFIFVNYEQFSLFLKIRLCNSKYYAAADTSYVCKMNTQIDFCQGS